jgi:hypothetical protein
MFRLRHLTALLVSILALAALLAPAALGAEGIGPAKKLGGESTSTSTTTSSSRVKTTTSKETLTIATTSPADGQTLSGTAVWAIGVTAGTPTKVEFVVDGTAVWSDASAPFAGSLDTTKLTNGSHILSAVAYGSKGVSSRTGSGTRTRARTHPGCDRRPDLLGRDDRLTADR